jgi:hypothetical protein
MPHAAAGSVPIVLVELAAPDVAEADGFALVAMGLELDGRAAVGLQQFAAPVAVVEGRIGKDVVMLRSRNMAVCGTTSCWTWSPDLRSGRTIDRNRSWSAFQSGKLRRTAASLRQARPVSLHHTILLEPCKRLVQNLGRKQSCLFYLHW